MEDLPKACVILGAGASHDISGEGAPIKQADFRPPLSKDLFDIDSHRTYYDILRMYPGAEYLTQTLASKIKSEPISLEEELTKLSQHNDPVVVSHFKHIPPYLRDLIYNCSINYTPHPSSYSKLIHALLSDNPHKLLFIVLNYDELLERALTIYNASEFYFKNLMQPSFNDSS